MGLENKSRMEEGTRIFRETYAMKKGIRFYRKEFYYYCLDEWYSQGLDPHSDLSEEFTYDKPGFYTFEDLGWVTAAFQPSFPEKILEDRGEHELIQDEAGRSVLMFKGRRTGFMPEYVDHPVKDMDSWERLCKPRLDPSSPQRYAHFEAIKKDVADALSRGLFMSQRAIGGYMFLRSLMGPEGILYMVYDNPELIHDCMETWFNLTDRIIEERQKSITLDELYLAEDICYNHGPLISPDMMREFLIPYYQQLVKNTRDRQIDKSRHLYIQIDTDGFAPPVIPVYQEMGMDVMSPFEVASGCDVVQIGRQFPNLIMSGGIDKRILAQGKDAIDKHLDYILPAMSERGGFYPTCDHGVPPEVSLENYRHYRKRCLEY